MTEKPCELQLGSAADQLRSRRAGGFTLDGSEALEKRLAELCDQVRRAVCSVVPASRLDGLLLAGGYGRGEGGVLQTPEGQRPYNDLDFYVFLRGNVLLGHRAFGPKLLRLAHDLSANANAGVEIEFKITSLHRLRLSPVTMFSYDLILGHRWLSGHDGLLHGCDHHRDAGRIPQSEATRLLWNRSSGLLFSAEQLARASFNAEETDFVGRNLAKAQLGFGDALLAAHGQYHWSCLERHHHLQKLLGESQLRWAEALLHHHTLGLEFKLHPVRSAEPREVLATRLRELSELGARLWLWLEARRLGGRFDSCRTYVLSSMNKCPEVPPLKCALVNLRTFGWQALLSRRAGHYPRERLFHALCLLLFDTGLGHPVEGLRQVQEELQTTAGSFPELVGAYQRLWSRFS